MARGPRGEKPQDAEDLACDGGGDRNAAMVDGGGGGAD
jgi:hypothetical protein